MKRAIVALSLAACAPASEAVPRVNLPAAARDACTFDDVALADVLAPTSKCAADGPPENAQLDPAIGQMLAATVSPERTAVGAGARVEIELALRNVAAASVTLYFQWPESDPPIAPYVFTQAGARVVPPADPPELACTPDEPRVRHARVTLAPGGTLRARFPWDANVQSWRADDARCALEATSAGPAPAGAYVVRLPLPLWHRERYAPTVADPSATVDVR